MDVTDAMVTNGMKDAGYEYVIISGELIYLDMCMQVHVCH